MNEGLATGLRDAIASHFGWQLHMKTALKSGRAHITSDEASRCDACAFGKWLADPQVRLEHGDSVQYRVIDRLHREFHQCAGKIIGEIEAGHIALAQTLVETEFKPQSDHLVAGLTKWIRDTRHETAA